MKTLKKTLCLVLAMVMVFGLCAVSASAKLGYGDTDDITYKEAVDVMSGIGILSGDSRGFRPTDTITRAEAAKIIAYIKIGNAKQADALKATSDPFADVPASHWAAGYIQYCASVGIIMGKADGYHPSENVKGLEFAAMLLRALGYGKQGEFVGSDWAINTSKFALRLGIFDGNLAGASATEDATREECALYAFNTLELNKVSYSELIGDYITAGAFSSSTGTIVDANMAKTFADDFGLEKVNVDEDAFGCLEGHYWVQNRKSNIITDTYADDSRLKATYTTAVSGDDLNKLLTNTVIKDSTLKYEIYVNDDAPYITQDYSGSNGALNTAAGTGSDDVTPDTGEISYSVANFKKGETKTLKGTGNGVLTNVYQWYAGDDCDVCATTTDHCHVRICIIDTYLAKVTTVSTPTGKDPTTKIDLVQDSSSQAIYSLDSNANKYTTDEFKKGDYVLVTISGTGATATIESMVAAPTVEGRISRFTKDGSKISVVSGGTTYVKAKNAAGKAIVSNPDELLAADKLTNSIVNGEDHILYIDKYGYLIATANVKSESNYVYVARWGLRDVDSANGLGTGSALMADVYYVDGTHEVVEVKLDKDKESDADKFGAFSGIAIDDLSSVGSSADTAGSNAVGVYTLKQDGSKVILAKPDTYETTNLAGGGVNRGISTIATSIAADKDTVFFYVYKAYGDDDFSVTPYVGINAVPITASATTKAVPTTAIVDSGTAKAVSVTSLIETTTDKSPIYFYLGSTDKGNYNVNEVSNEWSIDYFVYDGTTDKVELSCKTKKADYAGDVGAVNDPGFVRIGTNGKLGYVDSTHAANDDLKGGKKDDKVYYVDPVASSAITDCDGITITTANGKYALEGAKIVDLRKNPDNAVSDADDLKELKADSTAWDAAKIAFTHSGDNNAIGALYIIDAT